MKRLFLPLLILAMPVLAMAQLNLKLTVHCEEPGTLFVKIQEQIEELGELTDVGELTVTGNLNSDDFNVIRNQMTNVTKLDIGGLSAESGQYVKVSSSKSKLQHVILPQTATVLGNELFAHCHELTTVVWPQNIEALPRYCFYDCPALTEANIPATVTSLGDYVFGNCKGLTSITFPDGISVIPSNCLTGCSKIETIHLPASLTTIKGYAFRGTAIRTFTLPKGVALDGEGIFRDCDSLRTCYFPDGLTNKEIGGERTFQGCDSLHYARLPEGVTEIPRFYYEYASLDALDLPSTVTTIREYAFQHITSPTTITLPATVTTIEEGAFSGSKVQRLSWPAHLTSIARIMFWDCKELESIDIPETVNSIGDQAFVGCTSLKSITIPEGVQTLDYVFSGCTALEHVTLPSTLTSIDSHCFANCAMTQINIPEGVTFIGTEAFKNVPLEELTLPSRLQAIYREAFYGGKYSRVVVPEGVLSIGKNAFRSNNLKTLDLPSTLLTLGGSLVGSNNSSYCDSIIFRAMVPPYWRETLFGNNDRKATLYVPEASVALYQDDTGYNVMSSIKPLTGVGSNILNVTKSITITPESPLQKGKYDVNIVTTRSMGLPTQCDYNPYLDVAEGAQLHAGKLNISLSTDFISINHDYSWPSFINHGTTIADQVNVNWYMASIHYFTPAFDTHYSDLQPEIEGLPFSIWSYDGAARAVGNFNATWIRLKAGDELKAGLGYLYTAPAIWSGNYNEYSGNPVMGYYHVNFPSHAGGQNNFLTTADVTTPLQHFSGEFAHNRNWNLIGQPYPAFFDIRGLDYDGPIVVWTGTSNGKWAAYSPLDDEVVLQPNQGIFLQAPDGVNSITFSADRRQHSRKFVKDGTANSRMALRRSDKNRQRIVYNLELKQEGQGAFTRFVINPDATMSYDIGRDAPAMAADSCLLLYTYQGGVAYAINERPLADGIIRLGMQLPEPGTYTLTLTPKAGSVLGGSAAESIWLIDTKEHTRTLLYPLSSFEGVTIEAPSEAVGGTFSNRFVIAIGDVDPTAISETEAAVPQRMEGLFNLGGQRISQPRHGLYINNGRIVFNK